MSKLPPPNPDVYRLAAEMVDSVQEQYSCNAVSAAFRRIYGGKDGAIPVALWPHREEHISQYAAMFAPYVRKNSRTGCVTPMPQNYGGIRYYTHPFWNKWSNNNTIATRVQALLLMAEICENLV